MHAKLPWPIFFVSLWYVDSRTEQNKECDKQARKKTSVEESDEQKKNEARE